MSKITKPGIYYDMQAADYFADPCPEPSLTQSIAKVLIERSALHAKCEHPRLRPQVEAIEEPEKYVAAQAIGNAAHLSMIRRGKEIAVAEFDSWRSDKSKAFREAAEAAGKTPILEKHMLRAHAMVLAARLQLIDGGFTLAFANGEGNGEVCIAWEEDGLWFRSLIDWMPQYMDVFYDYKTTGMSVAPHGIGRMMVDAGWDVQAAMHERGLAILDPGIKPKPTKRRYRFVVQENEPPYALIVCELSDAVMEMGRRKLEYAVGIWRTCMRTGAWPSYPAELHVPEYPGWAEAGWLNREIHEAGRRRAPQIASDHLMAG